MRNLAELPYFNRGTPEYNPTFEQPVHELIELASLIPRGEPNTYGATPLDMLSTMAQQTDLLTELLQYTYDIPEGVSLEIANYVNETFRDRFYARTGANDENYTTSLNKKSHYVDDEAVMEMISRAETGHASAAELLITQKLLGIRSVELACLTHPYGERIEMLDEMRQAVTDSVDIMGGEYTENPTERFRVKDVVLKDVATDDWATVHALSNRERFEIADQYGGMAGLLITRKRDLGVMPDGTIIRERSSFVLRTDESAGFTSEHRDAISAIGAEDWEEYVLEKAGLIEKIQEHMARDEHTVAIPIASTIYAFNSDIAKRVYDRLEETSDDKLEHLNMTHVEAALNGMRRTIIDDVDGMLYVGPEIKD